MPHLLTQSELAKALSIPDLTDATVTVHAIQTLIRLATKALLNYWSCDLRTIRSSPVVPVENNYDRLNYPVDGAARDARYTRYITNRYILKTQTSSAIPDVLAGLHSCTPINKLICLPGMVYRRDSIDRLHCAEPHQLDLWRLVNHKHCRSMTVGDLQVMIAQMIGTVLPGHQWRTVSSPHPYTKQGVQIDVLWQDEWVEVGECGLIADQVLEQAGLKATSGLAMGLGLDRLLMIRKIIPDIRLLRSTDHRVMEQMQDFSLYNPVSVMPAISRDLSLSVRKDTTEEMIGDKIRMQMSDSKSIESIIILSQTDYEALPEQARQRMGMTPEQKNILLKIIIRDLQVTLTSAQANKIRNKVYELLHEGSCHELIIDP